MRYSVQRVNYQPGQLQIPSEYTSHTRTAPESDDNRDIAQYLRFLFDNFRLIMGATVIVSLIGLAYALIAKPIYEANILIQVEDTTGSNGSGGGSQKNIQGDLSSVFDIKTVTASEIEVLRSRAVVSRAADNARLYIDIKPKYFPVIGERLARHSKTLSTPGILGYGGYVWGAERADVSIFSVPKSLEGARFTLTATGNDRFILTQKDHGITLSGKAGATGEYATRFGPVQLRVDYLLAKQGAQFSLVRSADLDSIERLQSALKISERGKQSGIIGVTLHGPDAKKTSAVLNEIGQEYIRQNVDRKSEKAKKSLDFLDRQLPHLKQELENSENEYKELRKRHGSVDLAEETKYLVQQSVSTQTKLFELKQKKVDMLTRYQNAHPLVEGIDQQMRELERQQSIIAGKIKELPVVEQNLARLSRDVKVNTELYTTLIGTAQQLSMLTSSEVGNARLLDAAAVPNRPVKPRPLFIVAAAAVIGVVLGIAAAFIRKLLYRRIDSPDEIEHMLGLQVSAAIPHSDSKVHRLRRARKQQKRKVMVLPHDSPYDSTVESLRGFRTSLQFSMHDSKNNIIVITGPTPGVGKSFVSANFSAVLASIGKSVLVIDGDMRTGHLHHYFGLERTAGLSDVIVGARSLEQVIHKNVVENVDFICTGHLPRKPAELLSDPRFVQLLHQVSCRYDFVLIDTAPVLSVSDALVMAPHAGTIYNIVRGGLTTMDEIEETVKRLNRAGGKVTGVVFNDLKSGFTRYSYASKFEKDQYVLESS